MPVISNSKIRIKGWATPKGTQRFQERFEGKESAGISIAARHFRRTTQNLMLGSLGMGTYLGRPTEEDSQHMTEAAVQSVRSGVINVLDSAINYRYQLSERALGKALNQLLEQGFQRDELFICSKNGFISPDADFRYNPDFRSWFHDHYLDSKMIKVSDIADGIHCMAPDFLQDQLEASLANLNLETLDLMYLHNSAESQIPVIGHDAFIERLKAAFSFYEKVRQKGRIRFYGMATWDCFRVKSSHEMYLSLETIVHLAQSIGGPDHGFRFIQLPFNLAFNEAVTLISQPVRGERMSLLNAASALGIGIFTSVPLLQGQLLGQPDLPHFEGLQTPSQFCLQFVRSQPGIIAPLVGHKQLDHVMENLKVAAISP